MFVTVREDAFGDDYVLKFCGRTGKTKIGGGVRLNQFVCGT